jgi:hypothetical protein
MMSNLELVRRLRDLGIIANGVSTVAAAKALLINRRVEGFEKWSDDRVLMAAMQALCSMDGIDVGKIDGLRGPQTQYAFDIYDARLRGPEAEAAVTEWRDEPSKIAKPSSAAVKAAQEKWPTQAGMTKFYGAPGTNQTMIALPYPMRLAWDKKTVVSRMSCNIKCKDATLRALKAALRHYGHPELTRLGLDLFGGSLNVRKMRGGSSWSMHSWGAAFDFDPDNNQLSWGKDRARMAKPEYAAFLDAWESEGATSLGRSANMDYQHLQFARLR